MSDCGHNTEQSEKLWTSYRRWSEIVVMKQELVRNCRHDQGPVRNLEAPFSLPDGAPFSLPDGAPFDPTLGPTPGPYPEESGAYT